MEERPFVRMKHHRPKLFGELRDETTYRSIASRKYGFSTLIFIGKKKNERKRHVKESAIIAYAAHACSWVRPNCIGSNIHR
jgi:hypothetical protein